MSNELLDSIILKCEKPARYVGGEYNTPDMTKKRDVDFCMCFPDNYEVAMSNLGIKILYHMINDQENYVCERCFTPWVDMGDSLKKHDIPLFSLETRRPISEFDFLGFSFQYELSYTNMLYMLELGKIPFFAADRDDSYPLIIAGGPCMCNPFPILDFCDIVVIGEGEQPLLDMLKLYKKGMKKSQYLQEISNIQGVLVPSLATQKRAKKAFVKNLDTSYFPTKILLPNIEVVHDRGIVELFRGCTRGCRFCQAGMIYRPIRERSASTVAKYVKEIVAATGYDEISMNSLSTGDYPHLKELLVSLSDFVKEKKVQLALPSLRLDSFTAEYAESSRRSSLTFAPEAGTQRLRDVINKNITEEDFEKAITDSFALGYTSVKLYFMIGLPTETKEDLDGMVEMAQKVKQIAQKMGKGKVRITVSCSTFIPKPFTPFQWCPQISPDEITEKHNYLSTIMKKNKINFNYHDMKTSILEAVLARGDRKLSGVILTAYKNGAVFDGWSEFFNFSIWQKAMEENGLSIETYCGKRDIDGLLEWDIIDMGVSKEFLKKEYQKAIDGQVTGDCRKKCQLCGMMSEGLC